VRGGGGRGGGGGGGGGGGQNSSSKAFGISFADRPKAKKTMLLSQNGRSSLKGPAKIRLRAGISKWLVSKKVHRIADGGTREECSQLGMQAYREAGREAGRQAGWPDGRQYWNCHVTTLNAGTA
jgi:hypothetical protein